MQNTLAGVYSRLHCRQRISEEEPSNHDGTATGKEGQP